MINQSVLESYITAEINDSLLYRELAKIAGNANSNQLLNEMAEDEATHATLFAKLYEDYYKKKFQPAIPPIHILKKDFPYIIADRILDESGDYRKYDMEMQNQTGMPIRNILHRASVDENVHAHRLAEILFEYLLNKQMNTVPIEPRKNEDNMPMDNLAQKTMFEINNSVENLAPIMTSKNKSDKMALHSAMRSAWSNNLWWMRSAAISIMSDLGCKDATVKRLLKSPGEISAIFKMYYADRANSIAELLEEYLSIWCEIAAAMKVGDEAKIEMLMNAWKTNAMDLCRVLCSLNSYYDSKTLNEFFSSHMEMSKRELHKMKKGKYEEAIKIFDDNLKMIMELADYLTDGIINSHHMS